MRYDDTTLDPPGPMVNVTVRPPGCAEPTWKTLGQLDTGADVTLIPASVADELQLAPEEYHIIMAGYDNAETERMAYFVDLEIAGHTLESVEVVAVPTDTVLVGRDVLNHFIVTLNGKTLTFELQDP